MTGVNFLDVLNDGGLQSIDFPKDSVSIVNQNPPPISIVLSDFFHKNKVGQPKEKQ